MTESNNQDELEEILSREEKRKAVKIIDPKDLIPKTIYFSEGVYEKADMLGPIIHNLTDRNLEWSGFLLASKNDPRYIVRDILIQKGQKIKNGDVKIDGEDVAKAAVKVQNNNERYGTDFYVIGWIHGHGNAYPHPSPVDIGNFITVLNSVSLNTEKSVSVPLNLIDTEIRKLIRKGKIIYKGDSLTDAKIEYELKEDLLKKLLEREGSDVEEILSRRNPTKLLELLLDSTEVKFFQPNIYGFSHFAIVNNKHETPYSAIAISTEKAITKTKSSSLIENVGISKVKVKNDIVFTKESLEEEIKRNIKLPRKRLYFFTKGGYTYTYKNGDSIGTTVTSNTPISSQSPISSNSAIYIPQRLIYTIEEIVNDFKSIGGERVEEVKSFMDMLEEVEKLNTFDEQTDAIYDYFTLRYGDPIIDEDKLSEDQQPLDESKTDALIVKIDSEEHTNPEDGN